MSPSAHSGQTYARISAVCFVLVALAWTTVVAMRLSYSVYDDTYIYLRYVHNVLEGCGLRYNCADAPLEGFTSPLYLALLVGAAAVFGLADDLETVTQLLGWLSMGATLSAAAVLALRSPGEAGDSSRGRGVSMGIAVLALLGSANHFMFNTVLGLETALGCLVVTCILASALRPGLPAMRILVCLGVLTRPEMALFIPALLVFPKARRVHYWWPLALAVMGIVLARYLLFDDIAPNTYWAKAGGTAGHFWLGLAFKNSFEC